MGAVKNFLMEVSCELGHEGEITAEVEAEASRRLGKPVYEEVYEFYEQQSMILDNELKQWQQWILAEFSIEEFSEQELKRNGGLSSVFDAIVFAVVEAGWWREFLECLKAAIEIQRRRNVIEIWEDDGLETVLTFEDEDFLDLRPYKPESRRPWGAAAETVEP